MTRASAVKSRTQAMNTLWGVMIGAPSPLRDELVQLTKRTLPLQFEQQHHNAAVPAA